MSERITGELRDATTAGVGLSAFNGNVLEETLSVLRTDFESRCDAIDSIHANLERENDRLKCELDRVLGELDEMHKTDGLSDNTGGFMQNAEHHAWAPESHYVMLPKDADGVPIHIGDVVEWSDGSTCEVVGIGDGGTLYYMDEMEGTIGWTNADGKRHHHEPTVEDVLRDMHAKLDEVTALYVGEAIDSDERDRDEARIFAQYAAKLQLRGDAE